MIVAKEQFYCNNYIDKTICKLEQVKQIFSSGRKNWKKKFKKKCQNEKNKMNDIFPLCEEKFIRMKKYVYIFWRLPKVILKFRSKNHRLPWKISDFLRKIQFQNCKRLKLFRIFAENCFVYTKNGRIFWTRKISN